MPGVWLGVALGWLVFLWGCREAVTRPNAPPGGSEGPPTLIVHPAQDTTVDSIGTLEIDVTVSDPALIDSVAIQFQGAPLAFPPAFPNDTAYHALYPVGLGALHHQPFSFVVSAANVLGYDTATASVNVRLK